MSSNVIRIFGNQLPAKSREEQKQLNLFDEPKSRYMLCLPMLELHGNTFVRLITKYRPQAVLDLRSHPYFGRPALDRATAFDLFKRNASVYVHKAFDLKAPLDQQGYWKLRSDATDFFSEEFGSRSFSCTTLAVLLNRWEEIEILEQAVRRTTDENCWYIISPDNE